MLLPALASAFQAGSRFGFNKHNKPGIFSQG
jgi:hypothetical protein